MRKPHPRNRNRFPCFAQRSHARPAAINGKASGLKQNLFSQKRNTVTGVFLSFWRLRTTSI